MNLNEKLTASEIKEHFNNPDELNLPEKYARNGEQRSKYLVKVISKLFPDKTITILEPGSNVGRNLHYLNIAGYNNLQGIEFSKKYFDAIHKYFPDILVKTYLGSIEEIIVDDNLMLDKYDLIFTMAVLEHIPPEIENIVFQGIVNRAKYLLTIEDEVCNSNRHFPRNYQQIFESLGMIQVKAWNFPPLSSSFKMRLFKGEK